MNEFSVIELIGIAIGLVMVYVFFKQAANVAGIKRHLEQQAINDAWVNYYTHLSENKKHEARQHLTYIIYYEMHQQRKWPALQREKYEELKDKYEADFAALGGQYPANPWATEN